MTQLLNLAHLDALIGECPFHRFLGIRAESLDVEGGVVVLRMPFRPEMSRSDGAAETHGGVTASLVDIAGDYAIATRLGHPVPTIDLRVDYLRLSRGVDLVAQGRVVKVGRRIGIADVEVRDDAGRLVAIGRGCYSTGP